MINTWCDAQRGIPLKAQVAWVQPGWDTCLLALTLVTHAIDHDGVRSGDGVSLPYH